MSTITEAVREQLMVGNEQYQRLRDEHTRYKISAQRTFRQATFPIEEQAEECA
jgi:hypothetical protein